MVTASTLAEVSESALLARILPFFAGGESLTVGPGDDGAVLVTGPTTVVTTDSMVRGRDWLDAWSTPGDVATKLLTQNLADIAAMGAESTAVVIALVADPQTPTSWAIEFARTLGDQAARAGVVVAGGDLSSAPEGVLMVSLTALGDLRGVAPVLRSGARPGDTVAVCGTLGRSAAGLALLQAGADPSEQVGGIRQACLDHHRRPTAPLLAGPAAARAGATSMIDVSDGLLRDGARVAAASGVRLALESRLLDPDLAVVREAVGDAALECVLAGGEEHCLVATFAGDLPDGWRPLGRVEEGAGITLDGQAQTARGWDHFASE
ncbi:thiamine-phosphate kinase [Nostocoides sp. HKS02]|uniref:thiamine-phosphate kinase n=1 Tax=Nostocoides sp. HKS02 TaxID=1813880 RepID=UPI0012B497EF|nr:thiamine-phosphate kinase [Tetrasphaera sp. HKS02]QGN57858.1 thiamine-phosphate kinase [Tetrasphaera sp. HKS02]